MKVNLLKNAFKILSASILFFSFLACSKGAPKYKEDIAVANVEVNDEYGAVKQEIYNDSPDNVASSTPLIPTDLKIIKSANAKYKVNDVKKATSKIKQVALKYSAYISDLRFENNLYRKENRFTIKVPKKHFDVIMDSISGFTEFTDYENITTQDVTEEYVDIQARLDTKLEVKKRYEDILRKNAKTVKDILATEEKLNTIQEEIESAQGRMKYLTNKVAYSTIQIDLYETVDYQEEPEVYNKTFGSKIKDGLVFGWNFIASIFIGLIHIWPLIIIGVIVYMILKKRLKKRN